MLCKRILYTGRVQGVGFRYTAQRLAQGFAVTGYVRNLPNGNVELVAQGEPGEVRGFLEVVAGRMADYIGQASELEEEPGNYPGFRIRH
jgi:acylphosphatase